MNSKTEYKKVRLTKQQAQIVNLASVQPLRFSSNGDFHRTLNTVRALFRKIGLYYCASGGVINVWSEKHNSILRPVLDSDGVSTQTLMLVAGVEYANVRRGADGWEIESIGRARGPLRPQGYADCAETNSFYSLTDNAQFTGEVNDKGATLVRVGSHVGGWSGSILPAIGQRVRATINHFGPAVVVAYFLEAGWIGVEVVCDARPAWHVRQNDGKHTQPLVFGAEIEALEGVTYAMKGIAS